MATSAGSIPISATFGSAQLEKDVLAALTRIQSKSSLTLTTSVFFERGVGDGNTSSIKYINPIQYLYNIHKFIYF